jgi:hypothetical protein
VSILPCLNTMILRTVRRWYSDKSPNRYGFLRPIRNRLRCQVSFAVPKHGSRLAPPRPEIGLAGLSSRCGPSQTHAATPLRCSPVTQAIAFQSSKNRHHQLGGDDTAGGPCLSASGLSLTGFLFPLLQPMFRMVGQPAIRQQGSQGQPCRQGRWPHSIRTISRLLARGVGYSQEERGTPQEW